MGEACSEVKDDCGDDYDAMNGADDHVTPATLLLRMFNRTATGPYCGAWRHIILEVYSSFQTNITYPVVECKGAVKRQLNA